MKRFWMWVVMMGLSAISYAAETSPASKPPVTVDLLSKVGEYVQKFYEAALPVAKKAYEIGLLTLQVDAASVLIPPVLAVVFSVWALRRLIAHKRKCELAMEKHNKERRWIKFSDTFDEFGYNFTCIIAVMPLAWPLLVWTKVWLWVKLICPELWLAHMAIEKLVN